MYQRISSRGARLWFPTNPSDTDTVTIGADVYEFDDDDTTTPGNIAVLLHASDSYRSLQNLVNAINRQGTENVTAVDRGPSCHLRPSATPGGAPLETTPNIAVSDACTPVAIAWDRANLNLTKLPAAYPTYPYYVFPINGAKTVTIIEKYSGAGAGGQAQYKFTLVSPDREVEAQENELQWVVNVKTKNFLTERKGETAGAGATAQFLLMDSDQIAAGFLYIYPKEIGNPGAAGESDLFIMGE
jgi:hypothetical protein